MSVSTKRRDHEPRMAMGFVKDWGGKDFVVLTWEPGGTPALVIQAAKKLDEGTRERCKAAFNSLLNELGLYATVKEQ